MSQTVNKSGNPCFLASESASTQTSSFSDGENTLGRSRSSSATANSPTQSVASRSSNHQPSVKRERENDPEGWGPRGKRSRTIGWASFNGGQDGSRSRRRRSESSDLLQRGSHKKRHDTTRSQSEAPEDQVYAESDHVSEHDIAMLQSENLGLQLIYAGQLKRMIEYNEAEIKRHDDILDDQEKTIRDLRITQTALEQTNRRYDETIRRNDALIRDFKLEFYNEFMSLIEDALDEEQEVLEFLVGGNL